MLTNGVTWQFYKIHFDKPIDKSLIFEVDLLQTTAKNTQLIECFGTLSREGFTQSSMTAFYQQQQATSKYSIGALLTTDAVLSTIKKELKKLSPTSKIDDDFLKNLLLTDVIKRELTEGEQAAAALDLIKKSARAQARLKAKVAA